MHTKLQKPLLALAGVAIIAACSSVKTDPDIMKAIEATVQNCKIEERYGWAKDCKNNEKETLKKLIEDKGQAASLGSLATALGSEDLKTRAVAADRLYDNYRSISELEKNPQAIDGAAVDLLIANLGKFSEYASFYAARSTTWLAMMTGKESALYAMLDKHPNEAAKTEAYRNLMRYGRMTAFPKIKELAGSSDDKIALAAVTAPRDMYKYNEQERSEICDWAAPMMSNSNENIAARAAQILALRCKGEYIDKVLDEAEKRAGADGLKQPFASVLTNFTFSCEGFLGSKPTGSAEQCKRKEELKAKISK
ncbi:MAG: hypothetical protein KDK39_01555 [Leptospiraceae bacterium]|nr:hypothetical protein [Leptospiraceae bacterium]